MSSFFGVPTSAPSSKPTSSATAAGGQQSLFPSSSSLLPTGGEEKAKLSTPSLFASSASLSSSLGSSSLFPPSTQPSSSSASLTAPSLLGSSSSSSSLSGVGLSSSPMFAQLSGATPLQLNDTSLGRDQSSLFPAAPSSSTPSPFSAPLFPSGSESAGAACAVRASPLGGAPKVAASEETGDCRDRVRSSCTGSPLPLSSLFWITDKAASPFLERVQHFEASDGDAGREDRDRRSEGQSACVASRSFSSVFPSSALTHAHIREKISTISHAARADSHRRQLHQRSARPASGSVPAASPLPSTETSPSTPPGDLLPVQLSCSCAGGESSRGSGTAGGPYSFSIVRQWSSSFPARGAPSSVVAIRVSPQPAAENGFELCGGSRETPAAGETAQAYTTLVSVLGYDVETQGPFSFVCCNASGSAIALLSRSACCVAALAGPESRDGARGPVCGDGGERESSEASSRRPVLRWLRDEDWDEEEETDGETVVRVRGLLLLDELQRNLELPTPGTSSGACPPPTGPPPRRDMVKCLFHPFAETALVLLSHEAPTPRREGSLSTAGCDEGADAEQAVLRLFDVAVSTEHPETEIFIPSCLPRDPRQTSSDQPPASQSAWGAERRRTLPVDFALGCSSEALDLWPALSVFLSPASVAVEGEEDAPACLCFCPFLPSRVPALPAPLALALREATTQARLLEEAVEAEQDAGERWDSHDACLLDPQTRLWLIQRDERSVGESLDAVPSEAPIRGPQERQFGPEDAARRRVPAAQWLTLRGDLRRTEKDDEKRDAPEKEGPQDVRAAEQPVRDCVVTAGKGGAEEDADGAAKNDRLLCGVQLFATNPLTMLLTATEAGDLLVWASADEITPCMRTVCGEQSELQGTEGQTGNHGAGGAPGAKHLQFFLLQKSHFCDAAADARDPLSSPSASRCPEGVCGSKAHSCVAGRLGLLPLPPSLTVSAVPAAFVYDACRVCLLQCHFLSASREASAAAAPGDAWGPIGDVSRPWVSLCGVLAVKNAGGAETQDEGACANAAAQGPLLCSLALQTLKHASDSHREAASAGAFPALALVGSCLSSSLFLFSLDVSPLLFGRAAAGIGAGRPEGVGARAGASVALPKQAGTKDLQAHAAEMLRRHQAQVEQVREKIRAAASAAQKASASGATKDMRHATAAAAEFASSLVTTLQFADANLLQSLRQGERRLRSSTTANLARCANALETQVKEMWETHERQTRRQKEDEKRLEQVQTNMALLESLCVEAGRQLRQKDESLRLQELEEAWAKLETDVAKLPHIILERCRLNGTQRGLAAEEDVERSGEEGVVFGGAGFHAAGKGGRIGEPKGFFGGEGESEMEIEERKVAAKLLGVIEAGGSQLSLLHERQAALESLMQKVSL
ncbi:putative armadillo/beta-catenin-like repeat-containing protein [Neospora caninum Liverpool]|uniref:Armadillo/beta-catenin-like repeat-containing protein, putative n=1 Tax=Neospora caninum (strain Liverpool) TaxID=572307 RepID=F0V908_NEOCL|nr:putative armadillo/beta-catenin-like repeat-containing protein [Neospora caninum Liverpool]CBZ50199.1 putative armadillo/beta-catenin-like repeat-containing protein [Neospora caninum Liverpool]CEL64799.1 TPA: armadillo/beta-catenin-like repeat-containing protein, putative [Neospora caninum Liverpool]|eukprot:XP_003880234.1 putative armadillo/beta-catenin-like repeat-containing protein [Neospora caninum Liverpool]